MESFVGHINAIRLTTEYDEKEVIPFLMTNFDWLNLIVSEIIPPFDKHNVQIK
jgi:hypothetical protein